MSGTVPHAVDEMLPIKETKASSCALLLIRDGKLSQHTRVYLTVFIPLQRDIYTYKAVTDMLNVLDTLQFNDQVDPL